MQPFLELRHIGLSYHTLDGEIPALSQVDFSVNEGEFISLVGPSGCGKSTILNIIAGLLKPEAGSVWIQGVPLEESKIPIGYMLQRDHLFEWRTIQKNIQLGLEINKEMTKENLDFVEKLLHTYQLADFKKKKPSQLSGGMRQRAALIRTLALNPPLLLLDEPFSALDYQTRLNVSDDIWNIIQREKKTAILVTHDISEAISMSNHVLVLSGAPASIKCEIPVVLEEKTPMKRRSASDFKKYFDTIWKELNSDDTFCKSTKVSQ